MTALLGPDLGNNALYGSKTSSGSLNPLMGLLKTHSQKKWVAGHLLNADLGGSGTNNANLTPLTVAANNAHKTFEAHIKDMLALCHKLDNDDRLTQLNDKWYGVLYKVVVPLIRYAAAAIVDLDDMHSYVYSHIILDYRFVTLPKFNPNSSQSAPPPDDIKCYSLVTNLDPKRTILQSVKRPNFTAGTVIRGWNEMDGGIHFTVQIHNAD